MPADPVKPQSKRDKAVAQRRQSILEAAMTCFIENGYHQTGVRDIAKRAGVSLGNLYNHFPGKHDVLAEIAALERADLEPFLQMLAEAEPAADVLGRFVTAYSAYLAKPENVLLTIEIYSEAMRKPDIGALFVANREELVAALSALIERGADEGAFRADLNPNETARIIFDLIDAGTYRSVIGEASMESILGGFRGFIAAALRP